METLQCPCMNEDFETDWMYNGEDVMNTSTVSIQGSALVLSNVSLSEHNGTYLCMENMTECQTFSVIVLGEYVLTSYLAVSKCLLFLLFNQFH